MKKIHTVCSLRVSKKEKEKRKEYNETVSWLISIGSTKLNLKAFKRDVGETFKGKLILCESRSNGFNFCSTFSKNSLQKRRQGRSSRFLFWAHISSTNFERGQAALQHNTKYLRTKEIIYKVLLNERLINLYLF